MTKNLIKKAQKATLFKKARNSKDGKLTKKAQTFLDMCKEYGFEPSIEFINLYSNEKILYEEYMSTYLDKGLRKKMTNEEIDTMWMLHDKLKNSIETFMKYSYPTMRSTQDKGYTGPRPIINIGLGILEKSIKSTDQIIDINSKENK